MEYRYSKFFRLVNALVDYSILNACLVIVFLLSNDMSWSALTMHDYRMHMVLANLLWFYSTSQTDLYQKILNTEAVPYLKKALWSLVIFIATSLLVNMLFGNAYLPLDILLSWIGAFSLSILGSKVLFLFVRKNQRRFWVDYKKVVVLGTGQTATELLEFFDKNTNLGYVVEGYFGDHVIEKYSHKFKFLGKVEGAVRYSAANGVSEIYSALSSDKLGALKKLMRDADHNLIRFRFVPDLTEYMDQNVLLEYYGALPIISRRKEPLEIKVNELIKQTFDYVFSFGVVVFILSWLVPIVAIAIKLDSRGPVFFRQLRSGKDNKPFFCLKFRSMVVNDDADSLQASRHDKRITRVGAFLRRTSIDEFPQFFNVLMGDMSIVGPRPHMLKHTEDYAEVVNDFMARHFATPGITGWAQVNGLRGETTEPESMSKRVKADLWYLENWSFLLDLKIVFLTLIQTVFSRNEKAF
jgi:Undecaprenyl-phosphate glucose phosphotransferase